MNLMSYARAFSPESASEDCTGRALWALGSTVQLARDEGHRQLARQMFERSLGAATDLGPRGRARRARRRERDRLVGARWAARSLHARRAGGVPGPDRARRDPRRVLGHLREPLLSPEGAERDGYVPNVVYSCGAMINGPDLVLPYELSDGAIGLATVALSNLVSALRGHSAI